MEDLITVIIPVYNVATYLDKCVKSIINQTYMNLEIIIVDDGSTDGSSDLCDLFSDNPRVIVIHQENRGQGSARNRALDIMNGDFVCFIDSDDSFKPECIEILHRLLTENKLDIATCNFDMFDEDNKFLKKRKEGTGYIELSGIEAIKSMWTQGVINIAPWGKLYKASLWKNVRFKECFSEDWATMHYIYEQSEKVGYTYESLLNYLVRSNSSIRAFQDKKLIMLDIAEDNMNFSKKYPELQNAANQKAVSVFFHLLFQLPDEEKYIQTRIEIINKIEMLRSCVLKDRECIRKTKFALYLSKLLGYRFTKIIFRTIKKKDIAF